MRALMTEYRGLGEEPSHQERRTQIVAQLVLFRRRIRLSQHALEFIYLAVFCFVITSLFLASETFMLSRVTPYITAAMFVLGVAFLLLVLLFEFLELRAGHHDRMLTSVEYFRHRPPFFAPSAGMKARKWSARHSLLVWLNISIVSPSWRFLRVVVSWATR
jgi:hypothetical protein